MTYKLAKTSQDADQYFGAVSLLLDGTDLQDKSLDTKAITVNGDAQVSTTQSKWNGSSLALDGNGDYLYAGTDSSFAFGTGDFTIECWVWRNGAQVNNTGILSTSTVTTTGSWQLSFNSNQQIFLFEAANTVFTSTNVLQNQTWYHVAVTRESGTFKLFVDGVLDKTNSINRDFTYEDLRVGINRGLLKSFNGYLQDVRITKGVARYTATFTPPTQPFTPALKTGADQYFYNTSLLIHGDGTNGSTNIVDSSYDPKTITVNGDAQISTTQSKFGGSSLYFDGARDYLTVSSSSDFNFGTGDFTIEFWANLTTLSGSRMLVDFRSSGSSQLAPTIYTAGTQLKFFNSGSNQIDGGTLSTSVWYHVAVSRQGTSTRMFLDGVQTGSTYSDSSNYPSRPVAVGGYVYSTGFDSQGYIDDLRITKGVARYIADFTPPTKAFPEY